MEDADLCVRMLVAGPSADGDDANASVALTTPLPACEDFGKWRLEAGKAGEPPTYRREDVRPEGRRRGRVVLVNRLVTTSGRRVEGLGNAKATAVHFLIGSGGTSARPGRHGSTLQEILCGRAVTEWENERARDVEPYTLHPHV